MGTSTPTMRSAQGRLAALTLHATRDSRALARSSYETRRAKLRAEIDPTGALAERDPQALERRVQAHINLQMQRLTLAKAERARDRAARAHATALTVLDLVREHEQDQLELDALMALVHPPVLCPSCYQREHPHARWPRLTSSRFCDHHLAQIAASKPKKKAAPVGTVAASSPLSAETPMNLTSGGEPIVAQRRRRTSTTRRHTRHGHDTPPAA